MSGVLPVKAQCLPFSQIPHSNRLFTDFLSWSPKVQPFYSRSPHFAEWLKDEAAAIQYDSARRTQVASILERQNQGWNASPRTMENITRLRSGAVAAVTGQQVGLFGGSLFSIFKALTALKLAEQATAAGVDCVPVFWLATQDHDLGEVSHINLPGKDGSLLSLSASTKGTENAPVGSIHFDAEVESLVSAAVELLGDGEAATWLRESYQPGETYGSAFAHFFARLFADWGVILLDASDPELNSVAEPIYRAAIEQAAELEGALLTRGKELESAGYDQQVKVNANSTLLFTLQSGSRVPVYRRSSGTAINFTIGEELISQADLLQRISSAPHEFSPNVLLRPVVQDFLLPTLLYTGGAAEIAYFAQVAVTYQALLQRVTPIFPRFSATLIEPRPQSLLERYQLALTDVMEGPEPLREKLADKALPQELHLAFNLAEKSLAQSLDAIREALARLDKTLIDSANTAAEKMQYQLDQLRARAARAELRQAEVLGRHASLLSQALYPNKILQERGIAGIYYLGHYGGSLLRDLYGCIHTDCLDHQVISI
jgi:bacillithiol biosynthesis cysteine-adding enzyme BshC